MKNDIYELVIEDMTEEGAGIGKADGYPLFIKDTVVGDRVKAVVIKDKKTYGYGRLLEVLEPSPDRVEPRCPVAGPCGGCQLQAMSYPAQLEFKRRKVLRNLTRIGGFSEDEIEVLPVIDMDEPWHYRNKAEYPVGRNKAGGIVMGFYAGRTHSIISTEECFLGQPHDARILAIVKAWMEEHDVPPYDEKTGSGIVRHVLIRSSAANGDTMVCLVVNTKKLRYADELAERLRELPEVASVSYNIQQDRGNRILGSSVVPVWGPDHITDRIGDLSFRISPLSFYQVNPVQMQRLYDTAIDFAGLTGSETVWDLYCGTGTISLSMARHAGRVFGVEIVPAAVEDAKKNAANNGIENAEFFLGRSEDVLPEYYARTGERADVIVVDPPRKGCAPELLDVMIRMEPRRIVYVSCDSATLARDLKILRAGGYMPQRIQPVDMFSQTVHTEVAVKLSHEK